MYYVQYEHLHSYVNYIVFSFFNLTIFMLDIRLAYVLALAIHSQINNYISLNPCYVYKYVLIHP